MVRATSCFLSRRTRRSNFCQLQQEEAHGLNHPPHQNPAPCSAPRFAWEIRAKRFLLSSSSGRIIVRLGALARHPRRRSRHHSRQQRRRPPRRRRHRRTWRTGAAARGSTCRARRRRSGARRGGRGARGARRVYGDSAARGTAGRGFLSCRGVGGATGSEADPPRHTLTAERRG